MAFRTSNRHSLGFKVRRAVRHTRERILLSLIAHLEGSTGHTTRATA